MSTSTATSSTHAAAPKNELWPEIADALTPHEWDDGARKVMGVAINLFIERHDHRAYITAASSGQFTHADGIFYGGAAPVWSNRILDDYTRRKLGHVRRLAVIDFHTGLGPRGYGELICRHPTDSEALARARRWYGNGVTSPAAGESGSPVIDGNLRMAFVGWLPRGRGHGGRHRVRHLSGRQGVQRPGRRQLAAPARRHDHAQGPRHQGGHPRDVLSRRPRLARGGAGTRRAGPGPRHRRDSPRQRVEEVEMVGGHCLCGEVRWERRRTDLVAGLLPLRELPTVDGIARRCLRRPGQRRLSLSGHQNRRCSSRRPARIGISAPAAARRSPTNPTSFRANCTSMPRP